jgi:hypothetical protein
VGTAEKPAVPTALAHIFLIFPATGSGGLLAVVPPGPQSVTYDRWVNLNP